MSAETPAPITVDPEDAKIVTLARATRARNGADEGAAVRDETGRTYTASTVALPSLELSALRTAVAMAVAGGAAASRPPPSSASATRRPTPIAPRSATWAARGPRSCWPARTPSYARSRPSEGRPQGPPHPRRKERSLLERQCHP